MRQDSAQSKNNRPQKYRTHKRPMVRLMVSIPDGLLAMVDKAAAEDFATRSDIIRIALLWYLRPQGCDFMQFDPEEVYKTLIHRKQTAAFREMTKDIPRYAGD